MSYNVAIIGAGWYGCHLASSLAGLGFSVKVFDRHERPLQEASGNNQFRLHLGFHYARHHGTRQQSRDGFLRFIERYPALSAPVERNIYAVPRGSSLIDYTTYKLIMVSSGIDFVELQGNFAPVYDVEGAMLTQERVLLISEARRYFSNRLGSALHLGHNVRSVIDLGSRVEVDGEAFDYAIDATWGQNAKLPIGVYFEPTLLLYYEARQPFPAITLVDGPLSSVYPTEDRDIFTLSSVTHTPLGRFATAAEARHVRDNVGLDLVERKRRAMEDEIMVNVPAFRDVFQFVGIQTAIKTKPLGKSDDRSCYVYRDGRIFSVMSGKIDTIFFATERILSMLEAENSAVPITSTASLRRDILIPVA